MTKGACVRSEVETLYGSLIMGRNKSTVAKSEWLLNIILRNQFNLFSPVGRRKNTKAQRWSGNILTLSGVK